MKELLDIPGRAGSKCVWGLLPRDRHCSDAATTVESAVFRCAEAGSRCLELAVIIQQVQGTHVRQFVAQETGDVVDAIGVHLALQCVAMLPHEIAAEPLSFAASVCHLPLSGSDGRRQCGKRRCGPNASTRQLQCTTGCRPLCKQYLSRQKALARCVDGPCGADACSMQHPVSNRNQAHGRCSLTKQLSEPSLPWRSHKLILICSGAMCCVSDDHSLQRLRDQLAVCEQHRVMLTSDPHKSVRGSSCWAGGCPGWVGRGVGRGAK